MKKLNPKITKLTNGVRVIVTSLPQLDSVTLTVWVGVGSRHEQEIDRGVSHFYEHIVFKGSNKFPSAAAITEGLDAIGSKFNAATSKEWTNFYVKSRVAHLDYAFNVLSDMILNPILKEDDIKKERLVILEEIAMSEDSPAEKVSEIFENLIFKGSELEHDISGTEKTLENISKYNFVSHRKNFYSPQNLVICVAGGVTDKECIKFAQKYFGDIEGERKLKDHRYTDTIQKFRSKQSGPQAVVSNQKREQAYAILGFPTSARGSKDRFAENVLTSILGQGMSSRLFSEVREQRGLAYSIYSHLEHYVDTGYLETYTAVDPAKAQEAIQVILHEIYSLADGSHKISEVELTKAKEYLKGHFTLALEDTRAVNGFFGEEEILMDRIQTPEEIIEGINKVTIQEVLEVAKKIFVSKQVNLAIIGPFADKDKFDKLIK